jgi:group I intron endonuclease
MEQSYIYCIENTINGHKYIGKHCGRDVDYFGSGVALKKAIKKHGVGAFIKTTLEYCLDSKASTREIYWIAYYNTYTGHGYNLTPGGDGWTKGMKHADTSITKIRNVKKGNVYITDEQKQLIRNSLAKYHNTLTPEQRSEIYGNGGRRQKGIKKEPFSDEHRRNLSKGQTGKSKKQTKEHRAKIGMTKRVKIDMYSRQGDFLQRFESLTAASAAINGLVSEISKSCKDGKTTVRGYTFKKSKENE